MDLLQRSQGLLMVNGLDVMLLNLLRRDALHLFAAVMTEVGEDCPTLVYFVDGWVNVSKDLGDPLLIVRLLLFFGKLHDQFLLGALAALIIMRRDRLGVQLLCSHSWSTWVLLEDGAVDWTLQVSLMLPSSYLGWTVVVTRISSELAWVLRDWITDWLVAHCYSAFIKGQITKIILIALLEPRARRTWAKLARLRLYWTLRGIRSLSTLLDLEWPCCLPNRDLLSLLLLAVLLDILLDFLVDGVNLKVVLPVKVLDFDGSPRVKVQFHQFIVWHVGGITLVHVARVAVDFEAGYFFLRHLLQSILVLAAPEGRLLEWSQVREVALALLTGR